MAARLPLMRASGGAVMPWQAATGGPIPQDRQNRRARLRMMTPEQIDSIIAYTEDQELRRIAESVLAEKEGTEEPVGGLPPQQPPSPLIDLVRGYAARIPDQMRDGAKRINTGVGQQVVSPESMEASQYIDEPPPVAPTRYGSPNKVSIPLPPMGPEGYVESTGTRRGRIGAATGQIQAGEYPDELASARDRSLSRMGEIGDAISGAASDAYSGVTRGAANFGRGFMRGLQPDLGDPRIGKPRTGMPPLPRGYAEYVGDVSPVGMPPLPRSGNQYGEWPPQVVAAGEDEQGPPEVYDLTPEAAATEAVAAIPPPAALSVPIAPIPEGRARQMVAAERSFDPARPAESRQANVLENMAAPDLPGYEMPSAPQASTPQTTARSYIERLLEKGTGEVSDKDKWLALAQAGFGMAASQAHSPLQAFGQGAKMGLSSYRDSQRDAAQRQMRAVALAMQQEGADETKRAARVREGLSGDTLAETKRHNLSAEEYQKAVLGQGKWTVQGVNDEGNAILVDTDTGAQKTTGFKPAKLNSSSLERLSDRLRKENPDLSEAEALEIASGRASRASIADARLQQGNADSMRKWVDGWYTRNQMSPGMALRPEQQAALERERDAFAKTLPIPGTTRTAPRATVEESPVTPAAGPAQGTVVNGYRFKGGDPKNRANWEKVQ